MKTSWQPPRTLPGAKIEVRIAAFIFALLISSTFLPATHASAQTVATGPQADRAAAAQQHVARGKSTVRGRVVYDDTGRPLRRVQVTMYDPSSNNRNHHRMAWTDGNGEFILRNVPEGRYYVTVEAPGVVNQTPSDSEDDTTDIASVSVNGTSSAEVKVRVRRGGIISGRITYSDGDPALNAMISVLRKKDGKLIPVNLGLECGDHVQPDDRGVYRIPGLPPGEYVVGAGQQRMSEANREEGLRGYIDRAVLAVTYYEGTTNARSATPVQVEAGSENNNINITLVDRRTHKISGTLTMRGSSHPVTQARISLNDKNESGDPQLYYENQTVSPDEQGRWSLEEVPDGNYTVTVSPMSEYERHDIDEAGQRQIVRKTPPVFLIKRQDVTVAGTDVTGLMIEVSGGGRVSGTVMVEGGKPLPPNVIIYPETAQAERRIQIPPSLARVQPDGTFTVDGMPSDGVWIRAVIRADYKYYTKSVTANGVDLTQEPLVVNEGGEVKGVRIVISPEVAVLTGRILGSEGGKPLRGASIILVPAEPHKLRIHSARLYGKTNADGGFTLTGAPGEYLAVVLRPGTEAYMLGDEALKARAAEGQRITLLPNERKNMDMIAPARK